MKGKLAWIILWLRVIYLSSRGFLIANYETNPHPRARLLGSRVFPLFRTLAFLCSGSDMPWRVANSVQSEQSNIRQTSTAGRLSYEQHQSTFHFVMHLMNTWKSCNSVKNKKFREESIAYFPWYDTDRIEDDTPKDFSIVACVFVATVKFLPSRFLATIGYTHIDTQIDERDLWSSRAMVYIPSFMKNGSAIQKLIRGIHREHGDRTSLLSLFQNKESRLKIVSRYWRT
jgi:hypothetical protein